MNFDVKKFIVYTALPDEFETLPAPLDIWEKDAILFAFSIVHPKESSWLWRPRFNRFADTDRNLKRHKILSHRYFPEAEYSLWIEGSIQIKSTQALEQWAKECLGGCDLPSLNNISLKGYFDRVVLINLKRRPERLDFSNTLSAFYWRLIHSRLQEAVKILRLR